jgi:RNA polymerase sigma factor (sigma-70 family)
MDDFASLLEGEIPRLRRYARALTRDPIQADDLIQSCLTRALAKQHLWQAGTNLRAWRFTLMHNQHVNDVRRSAHEGVTVDVDDATSPVLTVHPIAMASLELRDLERAIGQLAPEQRQVILLVGLEGMQYEEVALILNVPVGTVRSRLSPGTVATPDGYGRQGAPQNPRCHARGESQSRLLKVNERGGRTPGQGVRAPGSRLAAARQGSSCR